MSFVTNVGSTADLGTTSPDTLLAVEPETGALLRTKGRLYLLCEVAPSLADGARFSREVVDLVQQEYYHDLSAGVEISLRRAVRQANRRVARQMGSLQARFTLHLACVVIVNNEVYAVRVGAARYFLIRRARLYLPGDQAGDLAEFVHRTTTRSAPSLGVEQDLLPGVWRQAIEDGDTVVIAAGALVEAIGAEQLKTAAVTLTPRSAVEHTRNVAVAGGAGGSASAFFIELVAASAASTRVNSTPEFTRPSEEVLFAESIRQRVHGAISHIPKFEQVLGDVTGPVGRSIQRLLTVTLELMPRRRPAMPRSPEHSRLKEQHHHRAVALLAIALIVGGGILGLAAYGDYERDREISDYASAFGAAQAEVTAARRAVERTPRDEIGAHERLAAATLHLGRAASSALADSRRVVVIAAEIDRLRDVLSNILIDLGRLAGAARPVQITQGVNGLYAADPGSGRLWRVHGEPVTTGVVMERGVRGVGSPIVVLAQGAVIFSIDDARKVWRAEGNGVTESTPSGGAPWKVVTSAALYDGNLYVLDEISGQVWKHESSEGRFGAGFAFLAQALAPGARSIAVDGGIWLIDRNGEIASYRRNPVAATASRVDLLLRWQGEAVRATQIQAIEGQRSIYLLDAPGRRVVQLTRDGRETARIALAATLEEPSAFYVSETQRRVYSVHGGKISVTDLR